MSYPSVTDSTFSPLGPIEPIERKANCAHYVFLALGIITLIGSLVATGMLYSQLGTTSLAIAGGGVAVALLSFILSRYCYTLIPPATSPVIPTTSSVTQEEPTLPSLLDLTITGESPLLQALPMTQFQRQRSDKVALFAEASLWGEEKRVGKQDIVSDHGLLETSLFFWVTRHPLISYATEQLEIINDPTRKTQVELINARIEELDKAVQLKERLERGIPFIPIKFLLPAWDDSPLKLALMTDEEISSLKLSACAHLNLSIVWGERERILELSKEHPEFTKKSMEDLLLIDLPKMKADEIYAFPPCTFGLIEETELKKIDVQKLSPDQLHFIFRYCVQSLEPAQVNVCIPQIKDKTLFKNLSDKQVLSFDLSQMDQEIFNVLFPLNVERTLDRLRNLKDKVSACYKFFGNPWYLKGLDSYEKRVAAKRAMGPPLPHLLDFKFDSLHPLSNWLSMTDLIKGEAIGKDEEALTLKDLLAVPLWFYYQGSTDSFYDTHRKALAIPRNEERMKLIKPRMEA